jgi:lipoprotein-anchoring transpeptidase ErfK/SrfK
MNEIKQAALGLALAITLIGAGCAVQPGDNSNRLTAAPSPSATASPFTDVSKTNALPVTLPVLDAMFSDEAFKAKLKSSVDLTDDQITQLQKIASDEVAKLRESNLEEQTAEGTRQGEQARSHAVEAIRGVIGEQKTESLFALAREYWVRGSDEAGSATADKTGPDNASTLPNAIPKDTRVVVNIPAFRMDVFRDGSLIKSYKIGIGYPEFPLPTGLRKAQTIIFNPTWTPPDEPWVAKMHGVSVGDKVEAGSKLNPLGPIKIPIGLPSLIHGGKSPAKLGTFASHGCVGLTTPQVQDFSKLLAQAAGTELSDSTIQANLKDKTNTKVVKLEKSVPVELRYETIVAEDGKLHIYRDVYDQDTNTEENLRAVLEANGVKLEDLSEDERTQVMNALNAMSGRPQSEATPKKTTELNAANQKTTEKTSEKTPKPARSKPIAKNQKEVVIEIAALKGKGYPAAVNLDTGSGKPPALVAKKAA